MAKKKARGVTTVDRKIHFYRIDCGSDDSGKPKPFDAKPALKHIDGLSFDNGRYMAGLGGNDTAVWLDAVSPYIRVKIGDVRRSGLPAIERRGALSPLKLPDGAGIAEQTHFVFFPDNILGAEFNFYGPRPNRLANYLMSKATDHCPEIAFAALLRQDVAERLKKLGKLTLLDLKILAAFSTVVTQADRDLGSALAAAAKAGKAETVEIVLKPIPRSQKFLDLSLRDAARRLFENPETRTSAKKFLLKGRNEDSDKIDVVDVLSDELIATKQVMLQDEGYRSVSSDSAYGAIEDAYQELRALLLTASSVAVAI